MKNIKMPLKLISNRVARTYIGEKLIDEFKEKIDPKDSNKPEEWIGSLVEARNIEKSSPNEGLSYIQLGSKKVLLKELITSNPAFYLGEKHLEKYGQDTAVLVKILDSAERLTIQVHPDKKDAKTYFNSNFGKTEAWYILGGRKINGESPYVLLGFKPGMNKAKWRELFRKQDIEGMINSLHKFYVEPGDVFLVEGGIPHAIGPGCFLMEIQEPTDYTIRVEKTTPSGQTIADDFCHQGIGFDNMFECFNYQGFTREQVGNKWKIDININKKNIEKNIGFKEINLMDTPYFKMKLYKVLNKYKFKNCEQIFSIFTVKSGKGKAFWQGGELFLKRGDSFFLPAGIEEIKLEAQEGESFSLLRSCPPN